MSDKPSPTDPNTLEIIKAISPALSIIVSVIIASATIYANAQHQREQARTDFILQAAEIVMNSQGPTGTERRAKALAELFPDFLPPNFGEQFKAINYATGADPDLSEKRELLQLLIDNPDQRQAILEMWVILFPEDKTWASGLVTAVSNQP